MARKLSDQIKREISQAVHHCDEVVQNINAVMEPFTEQHPEDALTLVAIAEGQKAVRDALLEFAKEQWMVDADGLESYRR